MAIKKKTSKKKSTVVPYHDLLIESLKNQDEALAYLNAALMDEDPEIFLIALRNVVEAQTKGIGTIAKKTDLNRESLYRMLSPKGNPELKSMRKILGVLGMNINIQADARHGR